MWWWLLVEACVRELLELAEWDIAFYWAFFTLWLLVLVGWIIGYVGWFVGLYVRILWIFNQALSLLKNNLRKLRIRHPTPIPSPPNLLLHHILINRSLTSNNIILIIIPLLLLLITNPIIRTPPTLRINLNIINPFSLIFR